MTRAAQTLAPTDTAAPASLHTALSVPGMHCGGCMGKVERALAAVPGVVAARANLTARSVGVDHVAGVAVPDLVAALAATGFAAQPRATVLEQAPSAVRPLLAPLAVAAFACMNVMLLSVSVWSGADGATRDLFHWLSALIGVPAIAYAGRPFFASAWGALKHGRTNMDVPISIGVTLATALSFYETVTHGAEAWFDGTLMLLLFLLAGRALDAMMRDRARAGVDALLRQAAPGAMVVAADGTPAWLAATDLAPGMIMRVAAGERLAADGVIQRGASRLDRSLLTGESAAVAAKVGDLVLAGTLNEEAPLDVEVRAIGEDTALAEIARLMETAGQSRSRYVRIADRASRLYAPAVHSLAALTFVGWMLAGAGLYKALVIAIAVLIITCPCALGLAVPVAQVVAAGALMKRGVLIKDGSALERLAEVDRMLIDKTGTLTLGRPVPDASALDALTPQEAGVALALASHSRHPLSLGLAEALAARGVKAAPLSEVEEVPGRGVTALWRGIAVSLGRPSSPAGGMAAALALGADPVRLIGFADSLRPDALTALAALRRQGLEASILSGDNAQAVAQVARETGLTAQASASPQDKHDAIARLTAGGRRVLMVGDGLNDGPALAAAHASIAPGTASDVGRQAADVVFTGTSLMALPRCVAMARATMRVVRQNFALAIAYNLLAVPLAMAGLVTPLIAAVAMSTSSLIVVANSLRLSWVGGDVA
ncbi:MULTISPECIES: heavy metal translocating P-type ATPase [unclassified Novosphingobium]|uniref:heavy metal translocating P-type ATPase n=1 Tax=unclassified Novosphingobium TaxID=2644732 RepID=UPI000D31B76A|nr:MULTISPECIES: heavy metal translocating P-type ATPase [unclassified Novosphingobium]PTR11080.1 Cu2+-exporting ATPase [Novosphingobium sp. GV055]PUB03630.1 Cu2+-exporting ATPase [Novosphingobium sp. GV061]PUB20085.1 Cu2+-exporting ATPase [Novosphingobium sp. GV079]PUB41846.1 Cu2+-exporting ATPase [Novosphingobium sp. GV027]